MGQAEFSGPTVSSRTSSGGKAEPPSHCRIVGSLEQPGHFGGSVQDPRALQMAADALSHGSFPSGIFY